MIDEDRYYESKFEEYMNGAKVPFEDYRELEDKYEELVNVVNACIDAGNYEELKEYMEDNND